MDHRDTDPGLGPPGDVATGALADQSPLKTPTAALFFLCANRSIPRGRRSESVLLSQREDRVELIDQLDLFIVPFGPGNLHLLAFQVGEVLAVSSPHPAALRRHDVLTGLRK